MATPATFGTVALSPAPTEPPPAKAFRRRWAYQDDYTMLKEILKAEAHMSPWWKKTERYTKAANAFNADPTTRWNTDHQHGKDRFYLLKGGFEALDRRRCDRTAQEEVLNSMENLLVTRVEEHNGYQQKIAAERNEKNATEEDLMLKGKTMRDVAMSCRGASAMPDVTEGGAPPGGGSGGDPKKSSSQKTPTRARARSELDDGGVAEFVAAMERIEARKEELSARELALRERQLAHEQALLEGTRARRAEDRSERVRREACSAEYTDTARAERAALTRAISALSPKMPPAEK